VFFGTSAICSKILNDTKYIFNTVNSWQTLFSWQSQVAQKSWMIKIFQYSENIRATRVLQGKRKLLKNLEWYKIYIQYNEFRANSVFRASPSCSKILNDKKYIFNIVNSGHTLFLQGKGMLLKNPESKSIFNAVKIFRTNSVFQGKRKLLKNPEW